MNHGSLFSGIGGFDLAAEWMGWTNKFHCEWNPFGQKVLKHYWPQAESYSDITKTDFSIWRGRIDILTGGFPCQPYSTAGKRLGKEDERHLWPEMLRCIREVQPRFVVGENVSGLVNWNGGMVFDEVQAELEAQGYEVRPFILPACAVNAPHRRDRIWFIANTNSNSERSSRKSGSLESKGCFDNDVQGKWGGKTEQHSGSHEFLWASSDTNCDVHQRGLDFGRNTSQTKRSSGQANREIREAGERECLRIESGDNGNKWDVTDSNGIGLRGQSYRIGKPRFFGKNGTGDYWKNFPTQSPICDGNDGISSRLDGITFPKWRNESIKAGGNAIVPQVALQIFKAIEQFENLNK